MKIAQRGIFLKIQIEKKTIQRSFYTTSGPPTELLCYNTMIRREMSQEGFNLYPWSQCYREQIKKKTTPKIPNNNNNKTTCSSIKKMCLNMLFVHKTNTELCYHSTALLQSSPYILRAPSTVFWEEKK